MVANRLEPMSILVALADSSMDLGTFLTPLRANYILICQAPFQALEVAERFEPDLVLVDLQISSPEVLVRQFQQSLKGKKQVYVALMAKGAPQTVQPAGFDFALSLPASTLELEQLLVQVRQNLGIQTIPAA
jgi:CheY-like chemotaxis protein